MEYQDILRRMLKAYFEYANRSDVKAYQNDPHSGNTPEPKLVELKLPTDDAFLAWLNKDGNKILHRFNLYYDNFSRRISPDSNARITDVWLAVMDEGKWKLVC